MCIIIASMKDAEKPNSFNEVLDQLLKANNLPTFNMGTVAPPKLVSPNVSAASRGIDVVSEEVDDKGKLIRGPTSIQPSPRNASSASNGDSGDINSKLKSIKIYRRKGSPALSNFNLANMVKSGDVIIESPDLPLERCIKVLTTKSETSTNIISKSIELCKNEFENLKPSTCTEGVTRKRSQRLARDISNLS